MEQGVEEEEEQEVVEDEEDRGRNEMAVLHSSVSLFPRRLRLAHGTARGSRVPPG